MKLNTRFYWFTLLLMIMSAVPAFAQFEVSPDHFDDNASRIRPAAHSNSVADLKAKIAEQEKLLAGYQDRLLKKSALVAEARPALGDSGSAAAQSDFLRQKT